MNENHCRIRTDELVGWQAVTMSNGLIEVTVLPAKGADIYSFVDLASGIDVLGKTPWGLQTPAAPARPGTAGLRFLENYEGAWQELFPNTFAACSSRGQEIPLHGEVAGRPWEVTVIEDDVERIAIELHIDCECLPLSLTRRMTMRSNYPELVIEETVTNACDDLIYFVWGHHILLGAPLVGHGALIQAPACTVEIREPYEATHSLPGGQRNAWPDARRIDGQAADLSIVNGPEAGTHDHAYLTDFDEGRIMLSNARVGLEFELTWDSSVFRWLVNWRPFGGSRTEPLTGVYGTAFEPWVSPSNLDDALSANQALSLDGWASLATTLRAALRPIAASGQSDPRELERDLRHPELHLDQRGEETT